jgi:branched-chain amino acid transport system substrate-binding protein
MKRLFYTCSVLALVTSFTIAGGRTYAAHQAASSKGSMQQVRLCVSTPIGVPALKDLSQGIYNGVRLAVNQWRARFARAKLDLVDSLEMDYAKSDGSGYSTDIERQNGLRCLAQGNTYGYIGTLNSGAALVSEPVLNRGGMAMISPANTNPSLTAPSGRAAQEPATASGKLHYVSYYRTVTTDNLQGPAGAAFYKSGLKISSYFLVDDKLTYGAGLAQTFSHYGTTKLGMKQVGTGHIDPTDSASIAASGDSVSDQVVASHADGVYCGCDSETAFSFVRDLRTKGYTKPVMGGDAIFNQSWITNTKNGSINNYATSVGPDPLKSSRAFRAAYKRLFPGTVIGPYDATAYDAASILLNAVLEAHASGTLKGNGFSRRAAVLKFVSQTRYLGATGLTTFDHNGDTTNRIISIYAVKGGTWKYLAEAPKLPGLSPT